MLYRPALSTLLLIGLLLLPLSPVRATDYPAVNEDIWPSQNDVAQTAGNGKKLLENQWAEVIVSLQESNFVYSGFALPASSVNLNISVPAGKALIAGRFIDIPASTTITATASQTNFVFLKMTRDGANLATGASFEVNITGTQPADSLKIGTLVASGSAITSTTDTRPMGLAVAYRGPSAIGAGSTRTHEGAVTIASNQALQGLHFYTDFTLNASTTATLDDDSHRLIIVATGTITINGTIDAIGAGSLNGSGVTNGVGTAGGAGYSQPGGGGGGGNGGQVGGAGGAALLHGVIKLAGGAGGAVNTTGTAGTSVTGDKLVISDPLSIMGGAGGGGGGGLSGVSGGAGGRGGASIMLIAPNVVLGGASVLNTSGAAGGSGSGAGAGGGGGGGAGNVYIYTHNYTDSGATFTMSGGAGGSHVTTGGNGGAGANGVKQILLY